MRYIYRYSSSFTRLHKDFEPFQLGKGVRQGDTSSPTIFTGSLEMTFRNIDWENKGIKIDGEYLSNLRFAEDIVMYNKHVESKDTIKIEQEKPKKVDLYIYIGQDNDSS